MSALPKDEAAAAELRQIIKRSTEDLLLRLVADPKSSPALQAAAEEALVRGTGGSDSRHDLPDDKISEVIERMPDDLLKRAVDGDESAFEEAIALYKAGKLPERVETFQDHAAAARRIEERYRCSACSCSHCSADRAKPSPAAAKPPSPAAAGDDDEAMPSTPEQWKRHAAELARKSKS